MELNAQMQMDIAGLQQAINYSTMKKTMNQDAQSVASILQSLPAATSPSKMENAVTPYKGGNIDIRV